MKTVRLPLITTPGPCGGIGKGVEQLWISAPTALLTIVLLMLAAAVAFVACSATLAAGNAGVAEAARVAASAALIPVSLRNENLITLAMYNK